MICLRKLYGQATRCKLVVIKTLINVSSKSCIQTTELLVRIRELGYTPIRFKRLKVLLLKIQTGRQLKNCVEDFLPALIYNIPDLERMLCQKHAFCRVVLWKLWTNWDRNRLGKRFKDNFELTYFTNLSSYIR